MKPVYEVVISQDEDTRRYHLYVPQLHALTEALTWREIPMSANELIALVTDTSMNDFYTRLVMDGDVQVA